MEKVLTENGEIAKAVGEGGEGDFEDTQAVIQVFAKTFFGDGAVEVLIGGGDEAEVDAEVVATTDAGEGFFFDEAEKFDLDGEGDFGNFVEEQGATGGTFEVAGFGGEGSGEGSFFVAEEFGFEKGFREAGAGEGDEGLLLTRAVVVDDFGGEGFADPGGASDEDGGG